LRITPQAYFKAIKLSIEHGKMRIARDILSYCDEDDERMPDTFRRQLFTLILVGYAKLKDLPAAKQIFNEMRTVGPRPK